MNVRFAKRFWVLALSITMLAGAVSYAVADNRDPPAPPTDWVSEELRDHPLVGKIWSPKKQAFADLRTFGHDLALTRYALLGEVHDNADHHLWQAWAIRTISKLRGARIVEGAPQIDIIAMEMVTTAQNAALDKFYGRDVVVPRPRKPRDFARMLKWSKTGWPDFKIYEPIIAQALHEQLVIVPASASREFTRQLSKEGEEALGQGELERLALAEGLSGPASKALDKEIEDAHCNLLPVSAVPRMSLIQRFRDATMADSLLAVASGKGGILIAGNGHVRRDRGVPLYLIRRGVPSKQIMAVKHVEVIPDKLKPEDYAEAAAGADYLVFTPRAKREDPCERMRQHMKKKQSGSKNAKPANAKKEAE
ncbi:MAG: ChaN family lipoprotein [Filomicrobium sp.]